MLTDLKVWQKSHELVLKIYKETKNFPHEEKFGLSNQLRRSAMSIPANIAEGQGRKHRKEFLQFLYIARGSLEETKYYLLLAKDLDYLKNTSYELLFELSEEIGKMLRGLINSLA